MRDHGRRHGSGCRGPRPPIHRQPADDLSDAAAYQKVIGAIPATWGAHGDIALDADEEVIYFRTELAEDFGPRGMGAGPGGIGQVDIASGDLSHVVSLSFQVGHVQTDPWVAGQIIFSWQTGGKFPLRTWIVNADGSGLAPLYPGG